MPVPGPSDAGIFLIEEVIEEGVNCQTKRRFAKVIVQLFWQTAKIWP